MHTRWTGWDPRGGAKLDAERPGALPRSSEGPNEEHFELLALAGRGFRPPQWLTVLELDDRSELPARPGKSRDPALREVWSLEYRQVAQTAPRTEAPFGIYLLGVDPPDDASEAELEEFNDFYTNVHLVEVATRRNALRAVRHELVQTLKIPFPSAPRYLAAYEVDEAGAANRRHSGPPYSKGPDVWQRHTTPWRIWFRRLST